MNRVGELTFKTKFPSRQTSKINNNRNNKTRILQHNPYYDTTQPQNKHNSSTKRKVLQSAK